MSDPALAEALARFTMAVEFAYRSPQINQQWKQSIEDYRLLIAAARERLEMGEGEQVWWCVAHSISGEDTDGCFGDLPWHQGSCHLVPARLFLDKGDE